MKAEKRNNNDKSSLNLLVIIMCDLCVIYKLHPAKLCLFPSFTSLYDWKSLITPGELIISFMITRDYNKMLQLEYVPNLDFRSNAVYSHYFCNRPLSHFIHVDKFKFYDKELVLRSYLIHFWDFSDLQRKA